METKFIFGIDPDTHGALVQLNTHGDIVLAARFPLGKDGKRNWDNLRIMLSSLHPIRDVALVFIERQLGFEGQGQANILIPYGKIIGMLMAFGLRFAEVPPATWSAEYKDPGKKPKVEIPQEEKVLAQAIKNALSKSTQATLKAQLKRLKRARTLPGAKERKDKLRQKAQGMFPTHADMLQRDFDAGFGTVDASLIAEWGRRQWLKEHKVKEMQYEAQKMKQIDQLSGMGGAE